jgi:hypothetical protein
VAEAKIAGNSQEVEKLSIWKLMDILSYLSRQADKQREELEKAKTKNKIKKR